MTLWYWPRDLLIVSKLNIWPSNILSNLIWNLYFYNFSLAKLPFQLKNYCNLSQFWQSFPPSRNLIYFSESTELWDKILTLFLDCFILNGKHLRIEKCLMNLKILNMSWLNNQFIFKKCCQLKILTFKKWVLTWINDFFLMKTVY